MTINDDETIQISKKSLKIGILVVVVAAIILTTVFALPLNVENGDKTFDSNENNGPSDKVIEEISELTPDSESPEEIVEKSTNEDIKMSTEEDPIQWSVIGKEIPPGFELEIPLIMDYNQG